MDRFAIIETEIEVIENIYGYNDDSQDENFDDEHEVHVETDNSYGIENPDDDLEGNRTELDLVPIWEQVDEIELCEEISINEFWNKDCCQEQCVKKFSKSEIRNYVMESLALDYYEDGVNKLNTALLVLIRSLYHDSNVDASHARQTSKRTNFYPNFHVKGIAVCKKFFLFAHSIGKKRLVRLLKTYRLEGVVEKQHGNVKRTPKNVTSFDSSSKVLQFLRNFAEDHALFMPGRIGSQFRIVKLLPSDKSKRAVYEEYEKACNNEGSIPVSLFTFRRIWRACCQDIVIQKPRSDLCDQCQKSYTSRPALIRMTEEERLEFLRKCELHLQKVLEERSYYNDIIKRSREDLKKTALKLTDRGSKRCNSYNGTIHISFDFAQQVHLPANSQQPGPVYFLTLYKVGIFGIMNDTDRSQCNVLIPEACQVSKGSNDVISFLHYYLENYSYGETHLHFHADNCVGQNKNNSVLAYFSWRIMKGLNKKISYSFMPVGHTKFSCDWAFGLIKKSFKKCTIYTLSELQNLIKKSTPDSSVNYSVLAGNESGDIFIPIYDWVGYFTTKELKPLIGITQYSHFQFEESHLGTVKYCESYDDAKIEHILFKNPGAFKKVQLNQLFSTGLSDERKNYLFEHVRPFCSKKSKDILCPAPLQFILKNDYQEPQKRGRGQPKKEKNTSCPGTSQIVSKDEKKTKKGERSRSQKMKTDTLCSSSPQISLKNDVNQPQKRRRGRPRKNL